MEESGVGWAMDFREYAKKKLLKPSDRILEFGPLNRATVYKDTHPKVRFADVRSTEDIKKLYTGNDYLESTGIKVNLDSIIDINHVVKGSYKEFFKGTAKFDALVLSHVIEHIPNIIYFFKDVSTILKKNGSLVIIYPDARYCFDHFRNGSSFIDAYDVYKDNKRSSNRVFDFVNNVLHENDPLLFWNLTEKNDVLPRNDFQKTLQAYDKALNNVLPDDTHFWPFSDHQFIKFLYDMDRAGLLDFEIDEFFPTQENTQEFMITLRPKAKNIIDIEKYKKALNATNPFVKEVKSRKRITILQEQSRQLRVEVKQLRNELSTMYGSKKWVYASRLAAIKNKISKRNAH